MRTLLDRATAVGGTRDRRRATGMAGRRCARAGCAPFGRRMERCTPCRLWGGDVFTVSVAREYANEGTEHLTQRGC